MSRAILWQYKQEEVLITVNDQRVKCLGFENYLQQPGEPLFLPHLPHFSASVAQHCSAPFSSPQLEHKAASTSVEQLDEKARQIERRETSNIFFIILKCVSDYILSREGGELVPWITFWLGAFLIFLPELILVPSVHRFQR